MALGDDRAGPASAPVRAAHRARTTPAKTTPRAWDTPPSPLWVWPGQLRLPAPRRRAPAPGAERSGGYATKLADPPPPATRLRVRAKVHRSARSLPRRRPAQTRPARLHRRARRKQRTARGARRPPDQPESLRFGTRLECRHNPRVSYAVSTALVTAFDRIRTVTEQSTQVGVAAVGSHLGGGRADPEALRDLRKREPFEPMQLDDLTLVDRNLLERPNHRATSVHLLLPQRPNPRLRERVSCEELGPPTSCSEIFPTKVERDREQPRPKLLIFVEVEPRAMELQEGLLHQIVRDLRRVQMRDNKRSRIGA